MPTKIEWTDEPWNCITGCSRGCSYCYARRMAYRLKGRYGYKKDRPFDLTFHPDKLLKPLEIKKPSKIFVNSMGELFDPNVPDFWLDLLVVVMRACPHHTFQVLTKRPDLIPHATEEYWPENLWLGVSIDGKTNGMNLIYDLYESAFPHHTFVSFEPLLGPIKDLDLETVQWVIIGAQTGQGAQETQYGWVWDIVNEAKEKKIPIFIKDNLRWRENLGIHLQQFPEAMTK